MSRSSARTSVRRKVSPPNICVVGSVNIDLVVTAPRLTSAGETVTGGVFATHPGGKGANQGLAAGRPAHA